VILILRFRAASPKAALLNKAMWSSGDNTSRT
jgi:hypothetical protein